MATTVQLDLQDTCSRRSRSVRHRGYDCCHMRQLAIELLRALASSSDSTTPRHVSPATKHGADSSARWNPTSVVTPRISNSSRARSARCRARSPSTSCTTSLAISGSYRSRSRRRRAPRVHTNSKPAGLPIRLDASGDGRNPRDTSSAFTRHSIAWPRRTTSSCASDRARRRRRAAARARCHARHLLGDRVLHLGTVFISRSSTSHPQ